MRLLLFGLGWVLVGCANAHATPVVSEAAPASATKDCPRVKATLLEASRKPSYSPEALRAGVRGTVKMAVTVEDNGVVSDAVVVRGLGYGLDEDAVSVVRSWRFRPASECGRATRSTVTVGLHYELLN